LGGIVKNLVLVSNIGDVPRSIISKVFVVSVNLWEEAILFLAGKTSDVAMFWSSGVPVDRLLKAVESFGGNLLVYSETEVNAVMRSRFTRVLRGGKRIVWKEIGSPTKLEELLNQVKISMGVSVAENSG
jgi:hypothetical protein